MNNKGLTLIELLIVIVVTGIIALFAVTAVGEVLSNSRKNALVISGNAFIDAAKLAYNNESSIFDDNIATLRELLNDGRIETIGKDPWGTSYNLDETYVSISEVTTSTKNMVPMFYLASSGSKIYTYNVRVVTETATIGFEGALSDFDKDDVVFLNPEDASIVDKIIESFDNNIDEDVSTDDGDDQLNVDEDISDGSNVNTFGGNDVINIGDDIKEGASVDTGSGDDIINMDGEVRDESNVSTGDGNDTIHIGDDIQDHSVVNTGDGDDTVVVTDDLQSGAVLNTGNGNDTVTVGDELDDGIIHTGEGDDSVTIDTLRDASEIDTSTGNDNVFIDGVSSSYDGTTQLGAGDDTLKIIDDSSSRYLKHTDGTFDGGSGYDTLLLPEISIKDWNKYVYKLFTNFEKVVLKDGIIYP